MAAHAKLLQQMQAADDDHDETMERIGRKAGARIAELEAEVEALESARVAAAKERAKATHNVVLAATVERRDAVLAAGACLSKVGRNGKRYE